MDLGLKQTIYRPYANQLAHNVRKALPQAIITISRNYIYIDLDYVLTDYKKFLYDLLATLPDISYPIETVYFIIRTKGQMHPSVIINPSEFDIMALQYAIDSELKFSSPGNSHPFSTEPIPLDHPYYTEDKLYFHKKYDRENKSKKGEVLSPEAKLFNKIKDQPNVKVILEQIAKDGLQS
ncbi:MAG: hypothetical protein EOO20_27160 [Chryseobacterium sp.]|nr:MAG: hypothetical protein EOO20_27160 [Chryseobacterium sp.]